MDFDSIWQIVVIVIGALGGIWGTKSFWAYIQFFKESVDPFVVLRGGGTDAQIGKEFREAVNHWPKSVKKKAIKQAEKKTNG